MVLRVLRERREVCVASQKYFHLKCYMKVIDGSAIEISSLWVPDGRGCAVTESFPRTGGRHLWSAYCMLSPPRGPGEGTRRERLRHFRHQDSKDCSFSFFLRDSQGCSPDLVPAALWPNLHQQASPTRHLSQEPLTSWAPSLCPSLGLFYHKYFIV